MGEVRCHCLSAASRRAPCLVGVSMSLSAGGLSSPNNNDYCWRVTHYSWRWEFFGVYFAAPAVLVYG